MPAACPVKTAARAAGEKWYFTGKPCKHGHVCDRLVSDGTCRECGHAKVNARYAADPEGGRRRAADYRQANPDTVREANRRYREDNLEACRARGRAWAEANPDKVKAKHYRRYWSNPEHERARSGRYGRVQASRRRKMARDNGGSFTLSDIVTLRAQQHGHCGACFEPLDDAFHVDHVTPLKRGGRNDKSNLQLLCPPCNMEKSAKDPIVFMRSRGFLL